jgi:hypothetical protein
VKLTFEGEDIQEIIRNMKRVLADIDGITRMARGPSREAVAEAVASSALKAAVSKPKKQAKSAAKPSKAKARSPNRIVLTDPGPPEPARPWPPASEPEPVIPPEVMQAEKSLQPEKFEDMVLEPEPEDEPEIFDPVKLTAIRIKTTEDLQTAYSNGKHKQVLALLAKYGNGAKSFRELQIKDFVPIRKAIDEGALT